MDAFGHVKLGGIGEKLAKKIEKQSGVETRHVILGHLARGGTPSAFDRVYGAGATGVAVGRNVWQHSDPLSITQKLKEVIFEGKRVV